MTRSLVSNKTFLLVHRHKDQTIRDTDNDRDSGLVILKGSVHKIKYASQ